jgi:hypothetical protein
VCKGKVGGDSGNLPAALYWPAWKKPKTAAAWLLRMHALACTYQVSKLKKVGLPVE